MNACASPACCRGAIQWSAMWMPRPNSHFGLSSVASRDKPAGKPQAGDAALDLALSNLKTAFFEPSAPNIWSRIGQLIKILAKLAAFLFNPDHTAQYEDVTKVSGSPPFLPLRLGAIRLLVVHQISPPFSWSDHQRFLSQATAAPQITHPVKLLPYSPSKLVS